MLEKLAVHFLSSVSRKKVGRKLLKLSKILQGDICSLLSVGPQTENIILIIQYNGPT